MSRLDLSLDSSTWFRTAASVELIPIERLDSEMLERAGELAEDLDVFGVARSGDHVMTVGHDVALALYSLREASPMLHLFRRDPDGEERISQLVLDGLLELRRGSQFVSGPEALTDPSTGPARESSTGLLSLLADTALCHAERIEGDIAQITSFLYAFNRLPLSPYWRQRLAHPERMLGTHEEMHATLASTWKSVRNDDGWLMWRRRHRRRQHRHDSATYKLYFSPLPIAVQETFDRWLEVAPTTKAHTFKVGAYAEGWLRPDKMVAYFADYESLAEAAGTLASQLDGLPAQGVPFTAPISSDGLLSWGMDPPEAERHGETRSWRWWVCHELAHALVLHRHNKTGRPARELALERLREARVDIENFQPPRDLWSQRTGSPLLTAETRERL